ncbi:uncharacterized protein J3D65DRAFT_622491 [Phyllosticta citribraziliensis]|uniref:Uncharacterized protein n=1 Tax=Phyllosticta citribraziliensis TaxID=989973 RepID=A0ABR1LTW5_9PEZI
MADVLQRFDPAEPQGITLTLHGKMYALPWVVAKRWDSVEPWIREFHARETKRQTQSTETGLTDPSLRELGSYDLVLDTSGDQKVSGAIVHPEFWEHSVLPGSKVMVHLWKSTSPLETKEATESEHHLSHDPALEPPLTHPQDVHPTAATGRWHCFSHPVDHNGNLLSSSIATPIPWAFRGAQDPRMPEPSLDCSLHWKEPVETTSVELQRIDVQGSYIDKFQFEIKLIEPFGYGKEQANLPTSLAGSRSDSKTSWSWLHVRQEFPNFESFKTLALASPNLSKSGNLRKATQNLLATVEQRLGHPTVQPGYIQPGTVLRFDGTEKNDEQDGSGAHVIFVCLPLLYRAESQTQFQSSEPKFSDSGANRKQERSSMQKFGDSPSQSGPRIGTSQLWALIVGQDALLTCGNVERESLFQSHNILNVSHSVVFGKNRNGNNFTLPLGNYETLWHLERTLQREFGSADALIAESELERWLNMFTSTQKSLLQVSLVDIEQSSLIIDSDEVQPLEKTSVFSLRHSFGGIDCELAKSRVPPILSWNIKPRVIGRVKEGDGNTAEETRSILLSRSSTIKPSAPINEFAETLRGEVSKISVPVLSNGVGEDNTREGMAHTKETPRQQRFLDAQKTILDRLHCQNQQKLSQCISELQKAFHYLISPGNHERCELKVVLWEAIELWILEFRKVSESAKIPQGEVAYMGRKNSAKWLRWIDLKEQTHISQHTIQPLEDSARFKDLTSALEVLKMQQGPSQFPPLLLEDLVWYVTDTQWAKLHDTCARYDRLFSAALAVIRSFASSCKRIYHGVALHSGVKGDVYGLTPAFVENVRVIENFFSRLSTDAQRITEHYFKVKVAGDLDDYLETRVQGLFIFANAIQNEVLRAEADIRCLLPPQGPFKTVMPLGDIGPHGVFTWATRSLLYSHSEWLPLIKSPGVFRPDEAVPIDLFDAIAKGLKDKAIKEPQRKLIREINQFQEELTFLQETCTTLRHTLENYSKVLDPNSYQVANERRKAQYQLEREAIRMTIDKIERKESRFKKLAKDCDVSVSKARMGIEIRDEDHGKAIFVFTVVTTIFLPLSFITSYFGMNFADVRDTAWNQDMYWAIAGPTTLAVGATVLIISYSTDELKNLFKFLWSSRFWRLNERLGRKSGNTIPPGGLTDGTSIPGTKPAIVAAKRLVSGTIHVIMRARGRPQVSTKAAEV